jgi:hypothetical protein
MFQHSLAREFATISVAVLIELMEAFVAKGILTRSDVRGIFTGAASQITPFETETAQRAVKVIDNHILPRFAEREGEQGAG